MNSMIGKIYVQAIRQKTADGKPGAAENARLNSDVNAHMYVQMKE